LVAFDCALRDAKNGTGRDKLERLDLRSYVDSTVGKRKCLT
jgi:hypothetical protein